MANFYLTKARLLGLLIFFLINSSVTVANDLTKDEILEAEKLLYKLSYWTGEIDGKVDEKTHYAIRAFQRTVNLKLTGNLTSIELENLRKASTLKPRETGYFHLEIDISKQILFFVYSDGTVKNILPISTGTNKLFTSNGWTRRARTPKGKFFVYRKIEGWRKSSLGNMHYPNYIKGGIAIHGSKKISDQRVTYGCIAIPVFASEKFSELSPVGTIVVIY